jgi:hypothetical protein
MRKLLFILIAASLMACTDKSPNVKIVNQATNKANVQLKFSNSNTININDVAGGQTTTPQEIPEGSCVVTAVIQNVSNSPTATFNSSKNKTYSVVIVNSNPISIRIDTEDQ